MAVVLSAHTPALVSTDPRSLVVNSASSPPTIAPTAMIGTAL
jgi:hypothetical protein